MTPWDPFVVCNTFFVSIILIERMSSSSNEKGWVVLLMAVLKKLVGTDAELFKALMNNKEDTVIDIEGQKYIVKPIQNEVHEEIEADIELKKIILQSKKDISVGHVLSTDEVLEVIERGEI